MTETSKENEMTETFKPLTAQQANDLVGRQATVTAYSMHNVVGGPHKHMTGTLVAYSIEPQVLIEDEHGEHTWWRRDMVALEKPEEPDVLGAVVYSVSHAKFWTRASVDPEESHVWAGGYDKCWFNWRQLPDDVTVVDPREFARGGGR